MTALIAAVLALSAPAAFAADHEGHDHGSMDMGHGEHSMMENGANTYTLEELKILNRKLKEANETLRALNKTGR